MNYIDILKIIGLSQVITTFAPISWLVELLPNNIFKYILVVLTTCWKCCALWTGLILFGLWPAITASIAASILIWLQQNIKDYLWRKNNL